ncbi:MAG: hypothetical protein ABW219_11925 [Ilumatobacteraceae bacterium]
MSHRALRALLLLGALAVLLGAPAGVAVAAPSTFPAGSEAGPPDTIVDEVTPITDNEFIPDRDLDDCVSALPQPGCGSEERSGWRQWAIFGLLVGALAFIGWRIVRTIREAQRPHDT